MSDKPTTQDEKTRNSGAQVDGKSNGAAADHTQRQASQTAPTNGAGPNANGQADDKNDADAKKSGPRWVKPVIIGAVILALIIGIPWGLSYWHFASTHVSTDDAYVTGNLVNVSPVISGTLSQLNVDEGDYVHKGQLIARLDDAGPQATLRQARANYNAALSQIPQAQRNLLYQQEATDAAIRRARASLAAQRAKASGAGQQVTLATGTTRNQVRQAQSQVQAAQAQLQQSQAQATAADVAVDNYRQAIETAQASLENYQQQIQTAQKAVQAAQARVQAAQADVDRTTKDEARYRVLYVQDAVSAQVYDNARAQSRNAQANLQAAQAQSDQAQSQVEQARASVRQAQSQVEQARKNVTQAQAQAGAAHRAADAARELVSVARAGLGLAQANSTQVGIQLANYQSTTQQTGESLADVATAQAGSQQVAVRRTQIETYRAQAQQALAAVTNAQIIEGDTSIYAPNDGTIVRKSANVGASLSPGQTILTMTQGNYVWVNANFKETQLKDVRPGESAEVEADAVPGKVFKGRVQSINEATGAATSLLPPDNATGNFTKVVQRIPVRIELMAANDNDDRKYGRQKDIENLRQGMSVTATIDTHSGSDNERQNGGQSSVNNNGQSAGGSGRMGSAPGTSGGGGAGAASSVNTNTPDSNGAGGGVSNSSSGNGSMSSGSGLSEQSGQGSGSRSSNMGGQGNGNSVPSNNIPNPGAGPGLNNGPGAGAPRPNTGSNNNSNGVGAPGAAMPGNGVNSGAGSSMPGAGPGNGGGNSTLGNANGPGSANGAGAGLGGPATGVGGAAGNSAAGNSATGSSGTGAAGAGGAGGAR